MLTHGDLLPGTLELGAFSMSLAAASLEASRVFCEQLGFVATGEDPDEDSLILKNGETTLGLFHGMFEGNILTFNPGLTNGMQQLEIFTDIRQLQSKLEDAGVKLVERVDQDSTGPASLSLVDSDGNKILIDRFF